VLDKPVNNEMDKKQEFTIEDVRLKKFVHKLSSLEQQLRTMEAKVYLCNEDVRQLNSEDCTKEDKNKLRQEYMTVQQGIESLLLEWESGKAVLESYLDPPTASPVQQQQQQEEEQQQTEQVKERVLF
jgi:dGTP triphosphohydrolase